MFVKQRISNVKKAIESREAAGSFSTYYVLKDLDSTYVTVFFVATVVLFLSIQARGRLASGCVASHRVGVFDTNQARAKYLRAHFWVSFEDFFPCALSKSHPLTKH